MKKLISTAFLLFVSSIISIVFNSCQKCGPFDPINYEIDKILVSNARIISYWDNLTKSFYYQSDSIETGQSVRYDSLALEININYKNSGVGITVLHSVFQGNTLMACSPPDPNYEYPVELTIVSDKPWVTSLPAGTDLKAVAMLVPEDQGAPISLISSFGTYAWQNSKLAILFTTKPSKSDTHVFTLTFKTQKGKEFVVKTKPILVLANN